ncbi:hypothetical protein Scep_006920 [Stephania cephalantha]|uniref:Uncharacterized protein n=1 Tax=Stephania cephalantha TaxID=152367 RepID=A0AAP0PKK0_9MAGN
MSTRIQNGNKGLSMLLEKTKLHLFEWRKQQPMTNSDNQIKALEEQLQRAHNDSDLD